MTKDAFMSRFASLLQEAGFDPNDGTEWYTVWFDVQGWANAKEWEK